MDNIYVTNCNIQIIHFTPLSFINTSINLLLLM